MSIVEVICASGLSYKKFKKLNCIFNKTYAWQKTISTI